MYIKKLFYLEHWGPLKGPYFTSLAKSISGTTLGSRRAARQRVKKSRQFFILHLFLNPISYQISGRANMGLGGGGGWYSYTSIIPQKKMKPKRLYCLIILYNIANTQQYWLWFGISSSYNDILLTRELILIFLFILDYHILRGGYPKSRQSFNPFHVVVFNKRKGWGADLPPLVIWLSEDILPSSVPVGQY